MRKFKKFIAAALSTAMVLGMVGATPATTAAAAGGATVSVSGSGGYITVTTDATTTKSDYVLVGVVAKNATEPKTYDAFEATLASTSIDLNISNTKDAEYWIKTGSNSEPVKLKYTAGARKVKVTYTPTATGSAAFKVEADGTTVDNKLVSSSFGTLNLVTEADISATLAYGATVYFRIPGAISGASSSGQVTTEAAIKLASVEGKLKMPKRGNAPKATIDYVKGTIKLPANALVATGSSVTYAEVGTAAKTYSLLEGSNTLAASGAAIRVKTAATAKKPESKLFVISASGTACTAQPATGVSVVTTSATKVDLKNDNAKEIEYVVVDKEKASEIDFAATTLKWKKIASSGKVTLNTSDVSGKIIAIRYPGTKATTTVAGELPSLVRIVKIDSNLIVSYPAQ